MRFLSRIAMGVVMGETMFLLGVVDVIRGKMMGVVFFGWATPVAAVVFWMSTPAADLAVAKYGQAPIPLVVYLIGYWALLGVVAFHAALFVKWLAHRGSRPSEVAGRRRRLP